ncbi:MAG: adenine nucleotide alpha-hydrolase family protein [Planctomycetota bacterium]|jgi:uncharacterized protein
MNDTTQKYQALKALLKQYGKVAIAFSGGVDSTFLLKAAVDTLGKSNVLACIGISPSLAQHQLAQAHDMVKLIGIDLIELPLEELDDPNYQANKADRCLNFDDKDDYRPGNIAVKSLGIGTPLMDAELTKADIRALSRELSLPTADLPASPCLASRLAYGETITEEKLKSKYLQEILKRSLLKASEGKSPKA